MTIDEKIDGLKRACGYAAEPDEADYPVNDSVDALIEYKNGLEEIAQHEGEALDRLAAFLYAEPRQFPGGADTCEALDQVLRATGRGPAA